MNKFNRDLLVLFKEELMNPQAIEHEVELLHELFRLKHTNWKEEASNEEI